MALLNLLADEMIGASETMTDPTSDAYAIIIKYEDDLKAPHKRFLTAHAALSTSAQPTEPERVKVIITAQAKLDVRHDAIIRGVWGLFDALVELLGAEAAASLIALRDWLIPDGLSSQNKTYGGEAGQAKQLADRMTPEIRKRTDAILVGEAPNARTLTSYIDEWISIGRQLGVHEAERGRIESEPAEGAALHNARLAWVRAVNAMITNAEAAMIPPAEMAVLFGALQAAERKADDRAREARAKVAADAKKVLDEKAAEEKAAAEKKPPTQ